VVYGTRSAEAHHIAYLSRGGEDSLLNMVLLCPNHHTVIHNTDATFDYSRLTFCFPNGRVEPLCLNAHLTRRSATSETVLSQPDSSGAAGGPDLSKLTQAILSRLTPDLLSPEWSAMRRPGGHAFAGYCYVASEALYHLAGGESSGLSVFRCSLSNGGSHWWLTDEQGRIIDPTAGQFGEPPPYASGKRTFFLSRKPSKRAQILMARVRSGVG
jgi:hypothetical protein